MTTARGAVAIIDQRRAERLAEERRAKRMAQDSAAHRVKCPSCGDGRSYTFRQSGELLFCCYGCGCQFDDNGAVIA